ncbi:MAG: thiolase family protein [Pseudomonadota bacterium]
MAADPIAYIPYGAYWSTPFARWQGALSHLHSLTFAAHVANGAISKRAIDMERIDFGVLGMTVPQKGCFYGLPWLTGQIGAAHIGGPTIMQACATGARIISLAAREVASGSAKAAIVVAADRVSNGPHIYYPAPTAMGGAGASEDWVLDNFAKDPFAGVAMVQTAENVASKFQISRQAQDDVALMRRSQYDQALKDDAAFLKRFMDLPFDVPDARGRKTLATLMGDDGVYPANEEKLRALKPAIEGGSVSFGTQTHPADGNAAMVLTTRDNAASMATDKAVEVSVLGFGLAREEPAYMPAAPVPAAKKALAQAELSIADIDIVTSHNPFAVNDLVFAKETGFPLDRMNPYGCSLVWGHPQGPTGLRSVIELIEALAIKGGGYGLFQGCAAGDTAMAVVVKVANRA